MSDPADTRRRATYEDLCAVRSRKMRVYAREGVSHLWLFDPIVRTLEILRLDGGRWVLLATHADSEVLRAEPFEAIEIELATLWADPPAATLNP